MGSWRRTGTEGERCIKKELGETDAGREESQ